MARFRSLEIDTMILTYKCFYYPGFKRQFCEYIEQKYTEEIHTCVTYLRRAAQIRLKNKIKHTDTVAIEKEEKEGGENTHFKCNKLIHVFLDKPTNYHNILLFSLAKQFYYLGVEQKSQRNKLLMLNSFK